MLIEMRSYLLEPGAAGEYLALYRVHGLDSQMRHLGRPLGCYTSETGDLNEVVFVWQYIDAADRSRRRAALLADSEFLAYFAKVKSLVRHQRSRLLNPVDLLPATRITGAL